MTAPGGCAASCDADYLAKHVGKYGKDCEIVAVAKDAGSEALPELITTINAANSSGLTAALGVNVAQATAAQIEVFVEQQSIHCNKGHWCSAANEIACNENTYNDLANAIDAGACKLCPLMSKSPAASTDL